MKWVLWNISEEEMPNSNRKLFMETGLNLNEWIEIFQAEKKDGYARQGEQEVQSQSYKRMWHPWWVMNWRVGFRHMLCVCGLESGRGD